MTGYFFTNRRVAKMLNYSFAILTTRDDTPMNRTGTMEIFQGALNSTAVIAAFSN
jgi:hypothetical protein